MAPGITAPLGDLSDEVQRYRPVIRKLHGALAGFIAGQSVRKMLNGLVAGIKAQVLFLRGKMDDVAFTTVSRHAIRDALLRIRKDFADGFPYLVKYLPYFR